MHFVYGLANGNVKQVGLLQDTYPNHVVSDNRIGTNILRPYESVGLDIEENPRNIRRKSVSVLNIYCKMVYVVELNLYNHTSLLYLLPFTSILTSKRED